MAHSKTFDDKKNYFQNNMEDIKSQMTNQTDQITHPETFATGFQENKDELLKYKTYGDIDRLITQDNADSIDEAILDSAEKNENNPLMREFIPKTAENFSIIDLLSAFWNNVNRKKKLLVNFKNVVF